MSDVKELLPCPWCGGEAAHGYTDYRRPLVDTTWDDGSPITEAFFVNCIKCGIDNGRSGLVGGYPTREQAAERWNTRLNATPAPAGDAAGEISPPFRRQITFLRDMVAKEIEGGSALDSTMVRAGLLVEICDAALTARRPAMGGEGFAEGIEAAAKECIRICRQAGEALEDGPKDATGWPMTPDGAARHQSFALADLIAESLEHETLRALTATTGDME